MNPTQPAPDHSPRPVHTVRRPVDLVAITPHLLGFHPEESVVLVTFGARDRPGEGSQPCHARVDLPSDPRHWPQVASTLTTALLHQAPDQAAVLVYSDDHVSSVGQAEVLVEQLVEAGIGVIDVLRVDAERWYHPLEDDLLGTVHDLASHPFTLERVLQGEVPARDRQELVDSVAPIHGEVERTARAMTSLLRMGGPRCDLRDEALWVQRTVRGHVGADPLAPDHVARLLWAIDDVGVRDVAWAEMRRETISDHVDLWRDVVRRAPAGFVAPAAGMLGMAAWISGQGALAWCAVDRMAEDRSDYSLTTLLRDILTNAVPPSLWTPIDVTELPVLARSSAPESAAG